MRVTLETARLGPTHQHPKRQAPRDGIVSSGHGQIRVYNSPRYPLSATLVSTSVSFPPVSFVTLTCFDVFSKQLFRLLFSLLHLFLLFFSETISTERRTGRMDLAVRVPIVVVGKRSSLLRKVTLPL
jgi:hypothetical protein